MANRSNSKPIDGKLLKEVIEDRGYTVSLMAQELGLSTAGIKNWIKRGRIPEYGIKLLDLVDIDYDEYRTETPEERAIREEAEKEMRAIKMSEQTENIMGALDSDSVMRICNAISSVDTHILMIYEELVKLNENFR